MYGVLHRKPLACCGTRSLSVGPPACLSAFFFFFIVVVVVVAP